MSLMPTRIESGHTVLFKSPNGDVKALKVEKNSTITVGRVGAFLANELINEQYGHTYEIVDKKLNAVPPKTLEDIEDTDATNELINDGESVQPLSLEEIEALKQTGVHSSDIIKMQIEQHTKYSLKTEYSKEKYRKRKEAKYSKSFTTLEPTIFNVCDYWFKKDQNRVRDIRPDTLAQMLNMANIRPGGRYLAVDDASGLVVAGILDRLGGNGRLITICDTESPPAYPVLATMNFNTEGVQLILSSLNWATVDETHEPVLPPTDVPSDKVRSERQRVRLKKRLGTTEALTSTRQELFSGEFDALIIASNYEPLSIIERLVKYLAGSGSLVVQSPFVQHLSDLQVKLRALPDWLNPTVNEGWLRQYQILPGRTHPFMNMSGSGGYLLHAIKIYDDPTVSAATAPRRPVKKPKTDSTQDQDQQPSVVSLACTEDSGEDPSAT